MNTAWLEYKAEIAVHPISSGKLSDLIAKVQKPDAPRYQHLAGFGTNLCWGRVSKHLVRECRREWDLAWVPMVYWTALLAELVGQTNPCQLYHADNIAVCYDTRGNQMMAWVPFCAFCQYASPA